LDHPCLKFEVKKTILDQDSENEQPVSEPSSDDDIDIEADKLNPNINFQKEEVVLNEQYFKMQLKDNFKMYTFREMNVQVFINLIANFIGEKLDSNVYGEILAPYPFINCTYNECNISYHGVSE
jgi:hypothetical protein